MPIPTPPQDLTGGFIVFQYQKGNIRHRALIHVGEFSAGTQDYTTPRGSETNVADTALAYATQFMNWYDDLWNMTVLSVWQMVSGVPVLQGLAPVISVTGAITGGAIIAPQLESGMQVWSFHTTLGNRAKIIQITINGWGSIEPATVNSSSSGPAGSLMTYLTGADTMIVAKDNTLLPNKARLTYPYNSRLRRHYAED